jgi:hypothetical protein
MSPRKHRGIPPEFQAEMQHPATSLAMRKDFFSYEVDSRNVLNELIEVS